ncbi:MAG: GTP-binding protein [Cognaticolwellia sp.]
MQPKKIIAVPTNIITGFLGVGKTSAILHLLKNKPEEERWAVLVNEFGEIGVDGSLMAGEYSEQYGVYIQEVPGGCMCCAAGVSMQVALNQLLKRAKPDRLLIEPTGLGHPKEVLKELSAEHYQTVLALQKTITLVDARNLSDQRYTTHDIFNQQIAVADTVIGNKVDVYQDGDKEKLIHYVKTHSQSNANVYFSQQGDIALSQLAGTAFLSLPSQPHRHAIKKALTSSLSMPKSGFIKAMNTAEGFSSIGWRFSSEKVFNHRKLQAFLISVTAERIKATFITELGTFGYNVATDDFTKKRLTDSKESRIEIISQQLDDSLEVKLMACIID